MAHDVTDGRVTIVEPRVTLREETDLHRCRRILTTESGYPGIDRYPPLDVPGLRP